MSEADPLFARICAESAALFRVAIHTTPEADPTARRLPLSGGLPPIWVATSELKLLVAVRQQLTTAYDRARRLATAEARVQSLLERTSDLLPAAPSGDSGLRAWSLREADIGLLRSFQGLGIACDGEFVRSEGMEPMDLETSLRIVSRDGVREVSVASGALFGVQAGRIVVVVLSASKLDHLDRQLVQMQATWLDRLETERRHACDLWRLRQEAQSLARDLQQRNAELHEAAARAQEAARARSTFLAQMSHELRTPLNGVIGTANLLSETPLTRQQAELIALQQQSGRWLHEIIDSILDFSKMESGTVELEELPFDLHDLLESCRASVAPLAIEKQLQLTLRLGPQVPKRVLGDPTRIRQATLNLLSNALKFTAAGEITLEASAGANEQVRIAVHDQGIGIDASHAEQLFEPFSQADQSTTRRFGGTGLGLPLVRAFARLHGGDAGAHGTLGEGSTFWFTARFRPAPAPACAPVPQAAPSVPAAHTPLRVLVVDDHAINRTITKAMLESRGHAVRCTVDGAEAVSLLMQDPAFDLVIMDWMMPVLDGLEATRRLRAAGAPWSSLSIVCLTASAMAEERRQCLTAGVDRVLLKPLTAEALDDALRWAQAAKPPPAPGTLGQRVGAAVRSMWRWLQPSTGL